MLTSYRNFADGLLNSDDTGGKAEQKRKSFDPAPAPNRRTDTEFKAKMF
jgi:hypothetical protein